MICVEDYLDSLAWTESMGGVAGLTARSNKNLAVVEAFVRDNSWAHFLAEDPKTRSNTSICLTLDLSPEKVKALTTLLEKEGVAFDIGSYRDAPPGLRLWGGATVESEDMEILCAWLRYAYFVVSEGK
jgi:phosphoserine aminotransferase